MHLVPDLCNTVAIILMNFMNISLYNQNYPTIKMNQVVTHNTNERQKHLTKPRIFNITPQVVKSLFLRRDKFYFLCIKHTYIHILCKQTYSLTVVFKFHNEVRDN